MHMAWGLYAGHYDGKPWAGLLFGALVCCSSHGSLAPVPFFSDRSGCVIHVEPACLYQYRWIGHVNGIKTIAGLSLMQLLKIAPFRV